MKISICQVERGTPNTKSFEVDWPAVPQVGSYVGSDSTWNGEPKFAGYVQQVQFYEDDSGVLTIEVWIQ